MHKVKIINEHEELIPTHIYIDDTEVHGVKSLEYFSAAVDVVPCFKFEVVGMPEVIEIGQAAIQFQFTPQTIQEATKALRHSLITDATLYDAFCASIESALKEADPSDSIETVAKSIADRIIGEE